MSRNVRLFIIAACLLFFAAPLMAQNATVLGTVFDSKGAPMPGVVVLLENKDTGFIKTSTTSGDGSFTISGVPPADGYKITASKQDGTQIGEPRDKITVNVGDEREILPPLREPLAVSAVAGSEPAAGTPAAAAAPAAPSGPAPIVRNETTITSIGGVITGDQLRSLPLYNRNFLVLGLLTPNTHDVEAGSPLSGASFSIAGQRPSSNNFLIDGADNVASNSNQAIPFQVNDAIQEFRVTSSTANAEFGRGAGGVVSVVTQSGKNALHGSVFGYFANDALNMDNPLSVYSGTGFDKAAAYAGSTSSAALTPAIAGHAVAPASYNQYVATAVANGFTTIPAGAAVPSGACNASNASGKFDPAAVLAKCGDNFRQPFDSKQFGANIGGAIVKNKLFFFSSYEGTRINNPNPIFERVPSSFDKSAPILNAAHTADYQLAKNILGLYPTSNVVAVPGALEFYQGTAPNYTNVHNALIRTDYKRSDSLKFNLRYAGQLLDQLHDDNLPNNSAYPGDGANRKAQNQNGTLYIEKTYKKITNETRLSLTQFRFTETPQDASFNAKSLGLNSPALQTILLSGLDTRYSGAAPGVAGAYGGWMDSFWSTNAASQQVAAAGMLPTLDGVFPFARIGAPLDAPSLHRDTAWSASDGFTWAKGKHSFKFGGDFRFIQNRVTDGGFSRGYIASGDIGQFVADSETCNTGTVAGTPCVGNSFRAPSFDYALNQQPNFNGLFNSYNYSGYGQDTWKVHKQVTVNAGLRYEYFGVPTEVNNQIWNYDPVANGLVQQGGTQVFDPFGYSCATTGTTSVVTSNIFTDSVPRDRSGALPKQWQCAGSTQGNIIPPDFNDFAGRLGIAYDVGGHGRTVIRAGVGLFYDQQPVSYMARLMENRPTLLNGANPRYIYGQDFAPANASFGGVANCVHCSFGNATVNPANANFDPLRQSAASPFGLFGRDNGHARAPYSRQVNVTLQQTLTPNVAIEIGYIGDGAHRLPIITNRGYNNEWFCTDSRVPISGAGIPAGSTAPTCDNFAAVPVEVQSNMGSSIYHSAIARVRIAQFHGLRMNATYTWSSSMDNASSSNPNLVPTPLITQALGLQQFGVANPFGFIITGGTPGANFPNITPAVAATIPASISGADTFTSSLTTTGAGQIFVSHYNLPQDPTNFLTNDYGPSDFNTTHRMVLDYNYEVPFKKDSAMWGNWQISGITTIQSGQPFTVFAGPLFGEITQRVNASGLTTTGDPNNYFSGVNTITLPGQVLVNGVRCFYASPATGSTLSSGVVGSPCLGNTSRNQFTGPAYASVDLAIQKGFKLWGEGKELSIRTEAFNLLNRANFYNPISAYSLDGVSTINPDFGKIKSAHPPLQLQFSARYIF